MALAQTRTPAKATFELRDSTAGWMKPLLKQYAYWLNCMMQTRIVSVYKIRIRVSETLSLAFPNRITRSALRSQR